MATTHLLDIVDSLATALVKANQNTLTESVIFADIERPLQATLVAYWSQTHHHAAAERAAEMTYQWMLDSWGEPVAEGIKHVARVLDEETANRQATDVHGSPLVIGQRYWVEYADERHAGTLTDVFPEDEYGVGVALDMTYGADVFTLRSGGASLRWIG